MHRYVMADKNMMAELSIISVKLIKNVVATYVNLTNRHFELA